MKLVVYGKGGIGKLIMSCNIFIVFVWCGKKVL